MKRVEKDIIDADVRIGTSEAQKGLRELAVGTKELTDENKVLLLAMKKLEAQGKKNSEECLQYFLF